MLVPAGIGTLSPRSFSAGRIAGARCYGDVVTLEPTGIVLLRAGRRLTLASIFRSWGEPLSNGRLASFSGPVTVFVNGRRWRGQPGELLLVKHSEIVLEVGPRVPPHTSFAFPPGT